MLKSRPRRRTNRSFQPEACEVLEDRKLLSATDINDQFSEAIDGGAMTTTKSGTGAIDFLTDVDMYQFTVEAGQTIKFEATGSGGLTPRMRLFGHIISQNRPPQEIESSTSSFSHTFTKAGTYYLGISEDANAFYNGQTGLGDQTGPFSQTGDFALKLTPSRSGDDNDQISEAVDFGKVNAKGKVRRGTIDNVQDVDMFQFRAKANHRVRFDINNTTGGLDTRLRLFNKKGKEIKWNDDAAGSNDSFFEHTFKRANTFYVAVSASGNNSFNPTSGTGDVDGNSTGDYELKISQKWLDNDDQVSEATDLGFVRQSKRVNRDGRISRRKDVDMFKVSVTSQHTLQVRANGMRIRIFMLDPNDRSKVIEIASGMNYVTRGTGLGGTFYIGISAAENTRYNPHSGLGDRAGTKGDYRLEVSATRR